MLLEEKCMKVEIFGIDAKKGLDLYDDNVQLYVEVLRSYALNAPAVLDKLRKLSAETLSDYAAAMHGMKGTSASVGAEKTRETAIKLEALAKSGDLSGLLTHNEAFLKETSALIDSIQSWLKKYDSKKA
jgi:HPt (histidine-containing phosphotransfer) domain-containing protein